MSANTTRTRQPLRVTCADRTFDISVAEGRLIVDGNEVAYSLADADGGLQSLLLDGCSYEVHVERDGPGLYAVTIDRQTWRVQVKDEYSQQSVNSDAHAVNTALTAPMHGMVHRVLVRPGDTVESGQGLIVLEAMKMENELRATGAGSVAAVHVEVGQAVKRDAVLVEFDA